MYSHNQVLELLWLYDDFTFLTVTENLWTGAYFRMPLLFGSENNVIMSTCSMCHPHYWN